jgi:VIT1/CCC1 family predicted Fe2+/Mn2+ transporter
MSDDELKRLSLDVSSLVPNARDALRQEMEQRQIQTATIHWDSHVPDRFGGEFSSDRKALAMDRYRNGYSIARAVAQFGATIKFVAILLGCLIAVVGFVAGKESSAVVIICLLSGVCVAVAGYCVGVIVQAAGELLKALFDTAVNGSHFLDDDDRARVMFS